jgi:hypothetical protein
MVKDINKGKRFAGDTFYPAKTEEEAVKEEALIEEFGKGPDVMDLDTYFSISGHGSNPVIQAAMKAFTPLRKATKEKWDAEFTKF